MAFGTDPIRTLLIEVGNVKAFSDVAGRHVIRLSNAPEKRKEIAGRLKTAGCDVSTIGDDWLNVGDFNVLRTIQKDSFNHLGIDLDAFDNAYKGFTAQLSYALGRYKGYITKLDPSNKKYTEVGVWERINEVKSARAQLLLVCGDNIRNILAEAGTEWLNDLHIFSEIAPSLLEQIQEVAHKDRNLIRLTRKT